MTSFAEKTAKAIELLQAHLDGLNVEGYDRRTARVSVLTLGRIFMESGVPYRATSWEGFGQRTRLWIFHDISKEYIEAAEAVVPADQFVRSMGFRSSEFEAEHLENWIKIVKNNRTKWMLARAKAWHGPRFVSGINLNWDLNAYIIESVQDQTADVIYISTVMELLEALKERDDTRLHAEDIRVTAKQYVEYIQDKQNHLEMLQGKRSEGKNNFSEMIRKRTQMLSDVELEQKVLAQFEGFAERLDKSPVALVQRTWGWEMEIADAKGVDAPYNSKVEKGSDGSLRSYEAGSDNCECDCSDCTYHECNCDYCESYNDCPEHCGDGHCTTGDSAEFRTIGPIIKSKHNALQTICKELTEREAEVNDTCGLHIHVYGADMKPKQIGNLLAIYMYLKPVLSPIAGRENDGYAQRMSVNNTLKALRKGQLPYLKPVEVNVNHLNGIGTIEFRQMAGTYDYKAIHGWAWIVRGLTEACRQGAQLRDFIHVNDFDQLLQVLIYKFSHDKRFENLDGVVYGSKMDQTQYTKGQFEFTN